MIKALFFDIGNVLLAFDYSRAAKRLLPHIHQDSHEIMRAILTLRDDLECGRMLRLEFVRHVRRITAFPGGDAELEEIYSDIFEPIPATWQLVEKLSSYLPIYLLSNTSEIHLEFIRKKFKIFHYFPSGIFSHEVGCMKPDPRIYEAAIALAGCEPHEIAFLDDMEPNVTAARAAGIHTHHYSSKQHDRLIEFLNDLGILD